jgi:hypothetical protein
MFEFNSDPDLEKFRILDPARIKLCTIYMGG